MSRKLLLNWVKEELGKVGGPVIHPDHYNACGERGEDGSVPFEPIKVIEAWGLGWGFCLGNALKYILRAPHKGSEMADLEKALWYLDRASSWQSRFEPLDLTRASCDAADVADAWGLGEALAEAVTAIEYDDAKKAAACIRKHLETLP